MCYNFFFQSFHLEFVKSVCSTLPEIPVIFIILLLIFFGVIIISYVLMWLLMDLCDIILHVLYFYV